MNGLGGKGPVDWAFRLRHLRCKRGTAVVLWCFHSAPGSNLVDHVHNEIGSELGERMLDLRARLVRSDRSWTHGKRRPSIQLAGDAHDGYAGFRIARHHSAMDGSGTTIGRQNGGVNVDHSQPRQREQRVGEDPAVSGNDSEIGTQG